ncbi:MAG: type IV secretory system conjugative DNA transfer family protein [Myxococcaceae bacterium]|nr:MAG: type IV secretory system conjugative DNA transfer family protein [Myxococcaceae bacterium]
MQPSSHPLLFATVDHRHNRGRVFGIRPADLARHVYVIGKTGVGKTALLERLLVSEIRAGHGVGLLDPHGDLADRMLEFIPRHRTNDVILFDPADTERPIGMNLLEHGEPNARPLIVSGILSVFRKTFAEFWGPRLENVFRNTLFALLEIRGSTLLGVMRMLGDERYRERVVALVRDPVVRFYWTREFAAYPKAFLAEVVSSVQNKVAAVLTNPLLRNIVGQHTSTFSPVDVMDEGKIFIANISKGKIGEDASALLGSALITRFQLAAYGRAHQDIEERRPFSLYIDEFGSFTTPSFGELLSEARKYRLALVLAHQHLGQLDDTLRRAVMGNAGTIIAFQVGAEDAATLEREFSPELTARDLTRLEPHQIAIRLGIDGSMSQPFTAMTLPPLEPGTGTAMRLGLRRAATHRYGRPRAQAERMTANQLM